MLENEKINMIGFKSNKKIIKYLIIIVVGILFKACDEKTTYSLQIGIKNATVYKLDVEVFAKDEYTKFDNLYMTSNGGYNNKEFPIYENNYRALFGTRNLDYTPIELTKKIFDSILITIDMDTTIIIKFSEKSSTNYKINMYENDSNWVYEKIEGSAPDNFNKNPIIIDRYSFEIKTDFIEIQNK
jgi:hypothetical protein